MICEECIYWKRCRADMFDDDDMEYQHRHCTIGEPRANYLRKPFNEEDTVFVLIDEKITEATVESLSYTDGSWDIELRYKNGKTFLFTEDEVGETIFKTREETEKK